VAVFVHANLKQSQSAAITTPHLMLLSTRGRELVKGRQDCDSKNKQCKYHFSVSFDAEAMESLLSRPTGQRATNLVLKNCHLVFSVYCKLLITFITLWQKLHGIISGLQC
jgi:hypothetical protein